MFRSVDIKAQNGKQGVRSEGGMDRGCKRGGRGVGGEGGKEYRLFGE